MPVLGLILSRLPATLEITLAAVIGATLIGVPLGMYAGYRPDSARGEVDHGALGARLLGADVLDRAVLIFTFAVNLGLLPAGGRGETRARSSASSGASSR